jgi:Flp pilus assembly protein TadG
MTQIFTRLSTHIRAFTTRSEGASSVEFAVFVPIIMSVFLASFENGITMVRKTLLDRALETTVRELRLGQINAPTAAIMEQRICERMMLITNCEANLTVELNVRNASSGTITLPSIASRCVNRATQVEPVLLFQPGAANDLVLVRVCLVQDIIFPVSAVAGKIPNADVNGRTEYQLISTSAFVNEPR